MKTLAQLNTYSGTTVIYTDQSAGSGQVLANRYQINGLIDTAQPVFQNIEKLCSAAGSWLSYDIHEGKWGVVINQSGTSIVSFNDSNIIGSISVSGTGLQELYNQTKVQFPHRELRDSADFVTIEIPSGDRNANEENNILNITYDIINDPVQAQLLGTIELKQSRIDLVIKFQTDFSYINLKAGDIIDVTDSRFGFTNKLFRIITITEVQEDNGALLMEITALQYDDNIYSTSDLYKYTRTDANGIITIGSIGVPGTPQVTKYEIDSRPRVIVSSTAPTGVVEGMEFWLSNDVGLADANRSYRLIATTKPTNGNVYTSGQTVQFDYDNIDTSNFVVKTRAFNSTVVGPFSSPSGLIIFTATQTTTAIGPNTKTIDGLGNVLTTLAVWELLKGVDGLYSKIANTSSLFTKIFETFTSATGIDLLGNAKNNLTPLTIKDEGLLLTTSTTALNFVGAGVTASHANGVTTISIPGGGGGGGGTGYTGSQGAQGYTGSAGTGYTGSGGGGGGGTTSTGVVYLTVAERYPPDRATGTDPTIGANTDFASIIGPYSIRYSSTITFYGPLTLGSGNIQLYKSDGTLVETLTAGNLSIDKNVLIMPFSQRELGTDYYILMDEGIVNYCNLAISPGISPPTTWNFNTPPYENTSTAISGNNYATTTTNIPSVVSLSPTGTSLCVTSPIVILYNIAVVPGSGNVKVYDLSGNLVQTLPAASATTATSTSLSFGAISGLTPGSTYYVLADAGVAVSKPDINCYKGAGASAAITSSSTWRFTVSPVFAYQSFSVSSTPFVGDVDKIKVNPQTNITLTFNRSITLGTGGYISIYKSDATLHQQIDVSKTFVNGKVSEILTVSGASLIINPTKDLSINTTYYLVADPGTIIDSCGASWSGISNNTTVRFSTDPGPSFTSNSPSDTNGVITMSFDRGVTPSAQTVDILDSTNTVVATITPTYS